jgi:hypothetical protein
VTTSATDTTATTATTLLSDAKRSRTGNNPCKCLKATTTQTNPDALQVQAGCGRPTYGTFAQGHDATTKSTLQAAHRAGLQIEVTNHEATFTTVELADVRGWFDFLAAPTAKPKATCVGLFGWATELVTSKAR